MCFVKPIRIKKVFKDHVLLENGINAYYEKKAGRLKQNDLVLVYGNVVINKIVDYAKI